MVFYLVRTIQQRPSIETTNKIIRHSLGAVYVVYESLLMNIKYSLKFLTCCKSFVTLNVNKVIWFSDHIFWNWWFQALSGARIFMKQSSIFLQLKFILTYLSFQSKTIIVFGNCLPCNFRISTICIRKYIYIIQIRYSLYIVTDCLS